MAREIGDTYEDVSLLQWVSFCQAAQSMVWAGHSKSEILGAAVYSNEDPYIRSTAYIVAETLGADPVPPRHHDFNNPFADDAANERLHFKRARAAFPPILEKVAIEDDPGLFVLAAHESTSALLEGAPAGWCAPALRQAYKAYIGNTDEHRPAAEAAHDAFQAALGSTPWPLIVRLHKLLTDERRRTGQALSPAQAAELIKQDESCASLAWVFE
jgi:hypothetical protein